MDDSELTVLYVNLKVADRPVAQNIIGPLLSTVVSHLSLALMSREVSNCDKV